METSFSLLTTLGATPVNMYSSREHGLQLMTKTQDLQSLPGAADSRDAGTNPQASGKMPARKCAMCFMGLRRRVLPNTAGASAECRETVLLHTVLSEKAWESCGPFSHNPFGL